MDSTGQSLVAGGLLGTGVATDQKKLTPIVDKENNSLNNNEFSKVLEGQKGKLSETALAPDKTVTASGAVVPEQALRVSTATQKLLPAASTGSNLPASGSPLPPGFSIQEGESVPQTEVPLVDAEAAVAASVESVVEDAAATVVFNAEKALVTDENVAAVPVAKVPPTPYEAASTIEGQLNPGRPDSLQNNLGNKSASSPVKLVSATGVGQEQLWQSMQVEDSGSRVKLAQDPVAAASSGRHSTEAAQLTAPELSRQFQLKPSLVTDKPGVVVAELSSDSIVENASPSSLLARTEAPGAYRQVDTATLQTAVPVEVGKPGWGDTVMQRVMWMSSQNINKAEIALDPPELGPLQIKITTQADQTSIVFTSNHGVVRDALDQGLPRLREMMANEGLDLADVDVSSENSGHDGQAADDSDEESDRGVARDGSATALAENQSAFNSGSEQQTLVGLIDQYV